MGRWSVRYFCEQGGSMPVADFFALPSRIGITLVEKTKFLARLELVRDHGLALIPRDSDVLETIADARNLYSLRIPRTRNNPRVLACALEGQRTIVLLHAFKELNRRAYRRAIPVAERRRDQVESDPERWVCDQEIPLGRGSL